MTENKRKNVTQICRMNGKKINRKKKEFRKNWQIYMMLMPAVIYLVIFHYAPIYGIQVAFRDYKAVRGITGSEFVGLKHFKTFFDAYYFERLLTNTFLLNLGGLIAGFLPPIIIALLLNRVRNSRIKGFIQTTIYIPHFISIAVLAGMLYCFLAPTNGIVNVVLRSMGFNFIDFMSRKEWFRPVYYLSGIWQGAGFGSILYLACLAGIDPTLYEAAELDGANVMQEIIHIDFQFLKPVITMQLIMNIGTMLSSNTDKVLILQTDGNIAVSDIIGTYVANVGIGKSQFSYTSAIGLFINIINFILIMIANTVSRKISENSLF